MVILTFIIFLIVFGLLVFIHELGHFLACKISGVGVEEFAIGFGPTLFSKKHKGTQYSVRAIPLGGYVKPKGERGSESKDADAYNNQPLYKRLFILFAGVFMNFMLAIVLGAVYMSLVNYRVLVQNIVEYNFIGPEVTTIPAGARITNVFEGSPLAGDVYGGDLLIGLNSEKVESIDQILEFLDQNQGDQVSLEFVNADSFETYTVDLILKTKVSEDDTILNVGFGRAASGNAAEDLIPSFYVLDYPENISAGLTYAIDMFGYQIAALGGGINDAVSQSDATKVTDQLAGPVGIFDLVGRIISSEQIKEILNLTVVLNLALAFFNLLPLPILDGGQAVIETIESIRGKRFSDTTITVLMYIALFFILILFVVALLNDLSRAGVFSAVGDALRQASGR